jgi:hypothetical protein
MFLRARSARTRKAATSSLSAPVEARQPAIIAITTRAARTAKPVIDAVAPKPLNGAWNSAMFRPKTFAPATRSMKSVRARPQAPNP